MYVSQIFSSKLERKGKIFLFGCILVFVLNGISCLFWSLFRTNILIHNLSINSCKLIYTANFVCYFVAKYILHCLLIARIYLTFYGTPYKMEHKSFLIIIAILSIHFFLSISIYIYQVTPHILKGSWMRYSICTLFSEHANQTLPVTLCAVSIGIEDFIVGSVALYILKRRLNKIASGTDDTDLIAKSARYGVVASIAMISTLFLFTLAVLFYKNVTFIISLDATINSLCIFCVLTIGHNTYYYLFCPFWFCPAKYIGNEEAVRSKSNINMIIIHKHLAPTKTQNELSLPLETNINNNNNNNGESQNKLIITNIASEPVSNKVHLNKKRLEAQYTSVSNPFF